MCWEPKTWVPMTPRRMTDDVFVTLMARIDEIRLVVEQMHERSKENVLG